MHLVGGTGLSRGMTTSPERSLARLILPPSLREEETNSLSSFFG